MFTIIDLPRGLAYNPFYSHNTLQNTEVSMEYLSIRQTSERWGLSPRRINELCCQERIVGAIKIGSYWAIPSDAEKPIDERIKTGKYIKNKSESVRSSNE